MAKSEHQIINHIRDSSKLSKLWDKLSKESKRELITEIEGDIWHLKEILEEYVENEKST
jgi:DNA-binding ferritin-like protein